MPALAAAMVAFAMLALPAGIVAAPVWSGLAPDAWTNATHAVWLPDMAAGVPAAAQTPHMKRGCWRAIPYELESGLKGTMLWASPNTKAPPIRLRLGVRGWHAIYVGLYGGAVTSTLWIRLSTDPAPVCRQNTHSDRYANLQDTFVKVADLRGDETIEIAQQSTGYTAGGGIAYVKLIPLSEAEVAGLSAERRDASAKKVVVTCDGYSFIWARRPTTAAELLAEIEPLRDTDVDTVLLHGAWSGDKVTYPSRFGVIPGLDVDDFAESGQGYFVQSMRVFLRKRINPVKVLIDGAHRVGLKVHVGVRPGGWSWAEPYRDFWETPFYKQHPQWRCVDRDGSPTTTLSWAVPEVRAHMIGLLMEMVGFGADGAHIVFNRGFPLVLYEQPFREMFRQRYGEDALQSGDDDLRIRQLRSDVVTTFLRELRTALDAEQKRRGDGKRLVISAMVLGTEYDNAWYGVDIRRLVNEDLLDDISIYPWDFGARRGGFDLAFFREVCRPKGVRFRPAVAYDLRRMVNLAASHYDAGADGIAIWDPPTADPLAWGVLSRFGHADEVRALAKGSLPAAKLLFFRTLGGNVLNGRFSPVWGG
jgi:hypothetical protein